MVMTSNVIPVLMLTASLLVFLAALVLAWHRRGVVARLQAQCRQVQTQLDTREQELRVALAQSQRLEADLASLQDDLAQRASRIDQLRDLIKVHVARRRELDEWTLPIKASLGDALGQTLRSLDERLLRQESALQRQDRLVTETQERAHAPRACIEELPYRSAQRTIHSH